MNKMIRDNQVAVLYSPGFGAGWYSWNQDHPELLFDPVVVQMVLDDRKHDIEAYCDRVYGEDEVYCGGAGDLVVRWLPTGTQFRIEEYDGSESLVVSDEIVWQTA
jgi:hypothetical protein